MSDEVTLKRIEIIEARVSDLEKKVGSVSAPIMDAIEGFRRDTLSMFESTKTEIIGALRGEMRNEIGTLRGEMRNEIGTLRGEMRNEIGTLRGEIKNDIAGTEKRLAAMIAELAAKK